MASAFLLRDLFPDADETNISGKILEGDTWTLHAGTGRVQTSRLEALTLTAFNGTSEFLITANAGRADVVASITGHAAGYYGLAVRMSADGNNGWVCVHYDPNLIIYQLEGGVYTQMASESVLGQLTSLRVTAMGNVITVTHNGGTALSHTSAFNNTATRCGIELATPGGPTARIDNFLVEAL